MDHPFFKKTVVSSISANQLTSLNKTPKSRVKHRTIQLFCHIPWPVSQKQMYEQPNANNGKYGERGFTEEGEQGGGQNEYGVRGNLVHWRDPGHGFNLPGSFRGRRTLCHCLGSGRPWGISFSAWASPAPGQPLLGGDWRGRGANLLGNIALVWFSRAVTMPKHPDECRGGGKGVAAERLCYTRGVLDSHPVDSLGRKELFLGQIT